MDSQLNDMQRKAVVQGGAEESKDMTLSMYQASQSSLSSSSLSAPLQSPSSSSSSSSPSFVIWCTGLPSSGKTTIATMLKPKLKQLGLNAEILDGDILRKELSPDLGFSKQDIYTHARKVIFVCKLLQQNKTVSIVSAVSPHIEIRDFIRNEVGNFIEVYVKCSLDTCIERDCKGLYRKAINGKMHNLIGLQIPYEEPINPDVIADTEHDTCDNVVDKIISKLKDLGYIQISEITNI
jgi:adenylylsulfate kinase